MCVNFIHKWRDLQSTSNDRFLKNFFMAGLFILRLLTRNLLRRNHRRNIFSFIFCFDACLTWNTNIFSIQKSNYRQIFYTKVYLWTNFLYKRTVIDIFSLQKHSYQTIFYTKVQFIDKFSVEITNYRQIYIYNWSL